FAPVADDSGQDPGKLDPSGVVAEQTGGARTHYAVDLVRSGRTLARFVFVDSSLRSLQASDPLQNPLEPSGQLVWLDSVLSSRPKGAQAVVVTNTPTYSYGPGSGSDTNSADATQLEAILFKDKASLVVSGRLDRNALYWATAPG